MDKVDVKFGEWMQKGFDLYKANFGILVVAGLLTLLVGSISAGILMGPLMAGMMMVTLALVDGKDPKPSGTDVFQGFNVFLQAFLLVLVVFIASAVVSMILAPLAWIVSIAISTCTLFAMPLIADRKMDFWPAIMTSFEKVKTNFFPFLGFAFVVGLLGGIGTLLCVIGVIFTFPIYAAMVCVAYRDVFPEEGDGDADSATAPEPPAPVAPAPTPETAPEQAATPDPAPPAPATPDAEEGGDAEKPR